MTCSKRKQYSMHSTCDIIVNIETFHWAKRKYIKFEVANQEGKHYPPLKISDAVLVKFGSRWYNYEVAEKCKGKT